MPSCSSTTRATSGRCPTSAAIAELEDLVQTMEGGKLELEDSITAYRRGMALLQHCQGQLTAAEQKIQIMEAGQLKDWNPEGERP